MSKYFGTDGFRGEANVGLTVEHAYRIGRFLDWYYGRAHKCAVVIGKDTRRSSYMFENALSAGLTASGADAYLMHVTTTPSVSYIVRSDDFDCGIMISASHNPYTDNGIKLLNSAGEKMEQSVIDVDEYGRVTAVGEGETVILIQCGDKRVETPAIVSFETETTETTAAPAAGTSGTGTTAGTNVATPSSGTVLKLKKSDITIGRRGVYVTLELENGISAESVTWSTSDSGVATVYNGNVTAIGKGTCVIRAEYNGQVAECIVRCKF